MSRGLGSMQRLVFSTLETRPGGDWFGRSQQPDFKLPDGWHDLRRVAKDLARQHGGITVCNFLSEKWQASFSRAIRSLERRGFIEFPYYLVPIDAVHPYCDKLRLEYLSDGTYLRLGNRPQRRFVRLSAKIHNA